MPAKRSKASATRQALRLLEGIGLTASEGEGARAGGLRREREDLGAIAHQRLVGLARPIPFEHGEFRVVQGAALPVAVDMGEAGDAGLARRQELLAGEFRRGVEVERRPRAVGADGLGCEGMEMRLVARRDLERGRIDLDEISRWRRSRAGPPGSGCAPIRKGRRSAWTCGVHQGEGAGRGLSIPKGSARSDWRFARR